MATIPTARSTGSHGLRRESHHRADRPRAPARWERPALAAVLGVAALLYAWGMGHAAIHPYYGSAIRSMATSWRAFFFGGLDTIQQLQPGDLVFFRTKELPGGRIGHVGIYLGQDTADHPRFISSRKNAGGPTMGDKGGTSRLDGGGYYAQGLRAARRL
ncbi:NlpC/P60 family protein [Streptomyces sp. NPDC007991]|uniref:NlpC/P60 family protein n=1 Tax=Streptomyces sp. NPDC007991 TaxID=3364803 RepID=UPI0036ED3429